MFHFIFAPKEYTFTLQKFHMFSDVGSTDTSPLVLELNTQCDTHRWEFKSSCMIKAMIDHRQYPLFGILSNTMSDGYNLMLHTKKLKSLKTSVLYHTSIKMVNISVQGLQFKSRWTDDQQF